MIAAVDHAPPATSNNTGRVLVVDDESPVRNLIQEVLSKSGHDVESAPDVPTAKSMLESGSYEVVVTDLTMPGDTGMDLVRWGQSKPLRCEWIVLTGSGRYEDAIAAVNEGVHEYLCKPLSDLDQLRKSVATALTRRRRVQRSVSMLRTLNRQRRDLERQNHELLSAMALSDRATREWDGELEQAGLLGQSLLPIELICTDRVSTYALHAPLTRVSGDLYDVFRIDAEHIGFYVADAAGHGISAAMLASMIKPRLEPLDPATGRARSAADVISRLATHLGPAAFEASMFITAAYGVLNLNTLNLSYANAGHPPAMLRRTCCGVERLAATGPAIGITPTTTVVELQIHLGTGDEFLIYSDGVPDAPNELGHRYGEAQVATMLESNAEQPSTVLPALWEDVQRHQKGTDGHDDVTLLLISVDGRRSRIIHPAGPSPRPAGT